MYYVETAGYAEKYGIDKAALKTMIEVVVKQNEKRERENKGELRRRQDRADKQKIVTTRESERKQERAERESERREREAKRDAERNERDKWRTFETVIKLPSNLHEIKLKALAKRIGEDVKVLRVEFEEFAQEGKGASADIVPWPKPIKTKTLLTEVTKQLKRYVVLSNERADAVVLWIGFAWLHDVAVHSPLLAFNSSDPDCGKTTACNVVKFLTPRAHSAAELTGPALFRFVDRVRPTLVTDDADRLLQRRPELGHIINVSWTSGTLIPRVGPYGDAVWFNPFCPKVIAGAKLVLPKTTATRTISIQLKPKLPSERVEDYSQTDNEQFHELRRKLARWAIDNATALKDAKPKLPPGFINRIAMNWRLQFAIADLAGGEWAKRARAAAIKLDNRQDKRSEGVRLLAAMRDLFANHGPQLASAEIVKLLTANEESEWAAFHNRSPITKREVAVLLDPYGINPGVIHPRGRKADRGYRVEWFTDAFERYLPNRTTVRKGGK